MLAIKNNIMAGNAARHLGKAYDSLATSVERLSSGLRINSAKDDAAGMAVRELIRADVAVLQQGSRNAQDGISMLQTMEGAMAVIDENLIRMKELAEQAATGSYSSDQRTIMNAEFAEMAAEIDRISASTSFNGNALLTAGASDVSIHVGTTDTITIAAKDMTTAATGLNIATGSSGYEYQDTFANTTDADGAGYITFNDTAGAADVLLNIQFTGGAASEDAIVITNADTASLSLNELVTAINAQTQNLGNDANGNSKNYAMAEAVRTSDGNYHLKLSSRLGDATGATMTVTSSGTEEVAGTGGFTDEADFTNDMTGAAGTGIGIDTVANALTALTRIGTAITTKDAARAEFGYKMNRLESTISILDIQAENLMTAESRISDVDVATEMATLTRTQVLSQAGISMLAQANSMPQMALSLLR
ncbi:MAG: hypothetical protein K8R02_10180 [Anaerohalosphaeraceae bacterium]|nr:hypothetical protein [Anaerohalosphaeraceae bacterium]